jgi:Tfp pilus assembly protein PilF
MAEESSDKLMKQAYQLLGEGDYQKALSKFEKVTKVDPNNAEAWFGKAEAAVLVPKVKTEDVLAAYKKAAELDPENAPYYLSEFGVEYFRRAPVVMEAYMDDKTEEMVIKKALKYLLLSIGLDEAGALELLQRK